MDLCSRIAGKKIAFGCNNKKEFGDKGLLTFGILVFSMPCYFLFGWVGGFFLGFLILSAVMIFGQLIIRLFTNDEKANDDLLDN